MNANLYRLLALTVLMLTGAACTPRARAEAEAEAQADSIAVWTEILRSGTLVQRVQVAGKLAAEDPASLPAATQEAIVAELVRINESLLYDRPIKGLDALDSESFGEYYLDLAVTAAGFGRPEANRALVLSVGVSRGMQRRAARLGDEAIPLLTEMIARDYQPADALETLALAWFWADSTGAPLADESRRVILEQLTSATGSERYSLRRAATTALELTGDPAFLPLAEHYRSSALEAGERLIAADLETDAIPALEGAAANLSAEELGVRSQRLLQLTCSAPAGGAETDVCAWLEERFEGALRDLRAGRVAAAKEALQAVVERVGAAAAAGALSADEEALIAGGARKLLRRL
jgi:hypothetical protein